MKFCGKCGGHLDRDKKFCTKCGAPNPGFVKASVAELTQPTTDNSEIILREREKAERDLAEKERINREEKERAKLIEEERERKERVEKIRREQEIKQRSKEDEELFNKLIEERELFKNQIEKLKYTLSQQEHTTFPPVQLSEKKQKSSWWPYLILFVCIATLGFGGYYAYVHYFLRDNYQVAQEAILKGNWSLAPINLRDAVNDAEHERLSSVLSKDEMDNLHFWTTTSEKIKNFVFNSRHTLTSKASQPADYLNCLNAFETIPLSKLRNTSLGGINTAFSLNQISLLADSIRLFGAKKMILTTKNISIIDGRVYYVEGPLEVNVDSLLESVSNKDEQGIKNLKEDVQSIKYVVVGFIQKQMNYESHQLLPKRIPSPSKQKVKFPRASAMPFQ